MKKQQSKLAITLLIISILLCISLNVYIIVKYISYNNTKQEGENESNSCESEENGESNIVETDSTMLEYIGIEPLDLSFLKMENAKENKVYSPLSIKYALSILKEASAGDSYTQIESVVGDYTANKYENSSNISLANAIFIRNTEKNNINKEYKTNIKNKFDGKIVFDSFENPNRINNWVKKRTFGLVNNVFDDVSDIDFALINTLAIDMDWLYQIQARITDKKDYDRLYYKVSYHHTNYGDYVRPIGFSQSEEDKFTTIKFGKNNIEIPAAQIGATINKYDIVSTLGKENIKKIVGDAFESSLANNGTTCGWEIHEKEQMLEQYVEEIDEHYKDVRYSTDFEFYVDDDVKVFAKDLKKYNGRTLQYIGIMPTNVELDSYINVLDANKVSQIIKNLKKIEADAFEDGYVYRITGYIPFFKYDYDLDLKSNLKKLGISNVFEQNTADLSNLSNKSGTYINTIKHKTTINFSNEGITAAATTTVGGDGATGCDIYRFDLPVKVIDLTFNKPFMYLIRDKDTGESLFVGTVYNPSIEE